MLSMMRALQSTFLVSGLVGTVAKVQHQFEAEMRQLENNYQKMVYGQCFWVQEYDNDSGAYQDVSHVSFYFCNEYNNNYYKNNENNASDGGYCPNSCSVPDNLYIVDLQTYLAANIQYLQNYCGDCNENCHDNQGRRWLEDAGDQGADYDCDNCKNTCGTVLSYMNDDRFEDESNYMNCQAAFSEDGIQYYSAPACACDGGISIGLFLDYKCTIKADRQYRSGHFSNSYFSTLEDKCLSPDKDNNNNNNFKNMMNNARMCDGAGNDLNGDDDGVNLCYGNYETVYDEQSCDTPYWNERERVRSTGAQVFWTFLGLVAAVLLTSYCCSFWGHREMVRKKNTVPLSSREGTGTEVRTTKQRSFR